MLYRGYAVLVFFWCFWHDLKSLPKQNKRLTQTLSAIDFNSSLYSYSCMSHSRHNDSIHTIIYFKIHAQIMVHYGKMSGSGRKIWGLTEAFSWRSNYDYNSCLLPLKKWPNLWNSIVHVCSSSSNHNYYNTQLVRCQYTCIS